METAIDAGTVTLRPARAGDGEALFAVTRASIAGLAAGSYGADHIAGWTGTRTPAFYEQVIEGGRATVAERDGRIVGFVDAVPGEVTRLYVLPEAAGRGLGARLLALGVAAARQRHAGPIKLEATLNAESFYKRQGFRTLGRGQFSHGVGDAPVEIVHMELAGEATAR